MGSLASHESRANRARRAAFRAWGFLGVHDDWRRFQPSMLSCGPRSRRHSFMHWSRVTRPPEPPHTAQAVSRLVAEHEVKTTAEAFTKLTPKVRRGHWGCPAVGGRATVKTGAYQTARRRTQATSSAAPKSNSVADGSEICTTRVSGTVPISPASFATNRFAYLGRISSKAW